MKPEKTSSAACSVDPSKARLFGIPSQGGTYRLRDFTPQTINPSFSMKFAPTDYQFFKQFTKDQIAPLCAEIKSIPNDLLDDELTQIFRNEFYEELVRTNPGVNLVLQKIPIRLSSWAFIAPGFESNDKALFDIYSKEWIKLRDTIIEVALAEFPSDIGVQKSCGILLNDYCTPFPVGPALRHDASLGLPERAKDASERTQHRKWIERFLWFNIIMAEPDSLRPKINKNKGLGVDKSWPDGRPLIPSRDGMFTLKRNIIKDLDTDYNVYHNNLLKKDFTVFKTTWFKSRRCIDMFNLRLTVAEDAATPEGFRTLAKANALGIAQVGYRQNNMDGPLDAITSFPYDASRLSQKDRKFCCEDVRDGGVIVGKWDSAKLKNLANKAFSSGRRSRSTQFVPETSDTLLISKIRPIYNHRTATILPADSIANKLLSRYTEDSAVGFPSLRKAHLELVRSFLEKENSEGRLVLVCSGDRSDSQTWITSNYEWFLSHLPTWLANYYKMTGVNVVKSEAGPRVLAGSNASGEAGTTNKTVLANRPDVLNVWGRVLQKHLGLKESDFLAAGWKCLIAALPQEIMSPKGVIRVLMPLDTDDFLWYLSVPRESLNVSALQSDLDRECEGREYQAEVGFENLAFGMRASSTSYEPSISLGLAKCLKPEEGKVANGDVYALRKFLLSKANPEVASIVNTAFKRCGYHTLDAFEKGASSAVSQLVDYGWTQDDLFNPYSPSEALQLSKVMMDLGYDPLAVEGRYSIDDCRPYLDSFLSYVGRSVSKAHLEEIISDIRDTLSQNPKLLQDFEKHLACIVYDREEVRLIK